MENLNQNGSYCKFQYRDVLRKTTETTLPEKEEESQVRETFLFKLNDILERVCELFIIKPYINKNMIYERRINTERILMYRKIAQESGLPEAEVRNVFCKGAEWGIDLVTRIGLTKS
jgi:hypothetical protein